MIDMNQVLIWNEIVKIQPRGVITIPRRFRTSDFDENSFVRVRKIGGKIILEPITVPRYSVRRYTDEEVNEFLEMDEKETLGLKKKGVLE